jgi:hypothetical protein
MCIWSTGPTIQGPIIELWPVGFAKNGKDLDRIFSQRSIFLGVTQDEYYLRIWLNEHARLQTPSMPRCTGFSTWIKSDK